MAVDYYYGLLPEGYTDAKQDISRALNLRHGWNNALASEEKYASDNCTSAFINCVTNDIPKIYICSSNAHLTKECILEEVEWSNRVLAKGETPVYLDDQFIAERLKAEEVQREEVIMPYLERMCYAHSFLLPKSEK